LTKCLLLRHIPSIDLVFLGLQILNTAQRNSVVLRANYVHLGRLGERLGRCLFLLDRATRTYLPFSLTPPSTAICPNQRHSIVCNHSAHLSHNNTIGRHLSTGATISLVSYSGTTNVQLMGMFFRHRLHLLSVGNEFKAARSREWWWPGTASPMSGLTCLLR
jgi:hypothetical protein